jgi:hypothetical protein
MTKGKVVRDDLTRFAQPQVERLSSYEIGVSVHCAKTPLMSKEGGGRIRANVVQALAPTRAW